MRKNIHNILLVCVSLIFNFQFSIRHKLRLCQIPTVSRSGRRCHASATPYTMTSCAIWNTYGQNTNFLTTSRRLAA